MWLVWTGPLALDRMLTLIETTCPAALFYLKVSLDSLGVNQNLSTFKMKKNADKFWHFDFLNFEPLILVLEPSPSLFQTMENFST